MTPICATRIIGDMMTLAEWMLANGFDDAALAARLNITLSNVSRIRRGKQIPSRERMAAIVEITGGKVQPNSFFGITLPAPQPEGCAA